MSETVLEQHPQAPSVVAPSSWALAFVDAVRGMSGRDLAHLRRNAGCNLTEARGIVPIFRLLGRFTGEGTDWDRQAREERLFLVACLLAFDKRTIEKGQTRAGDFGKTMDRLWHETKGANDREDDKPTSPIGRRFAILLDASFDGTGGGELAFRLRQTTRLVLSHEMPIDWALLLDDLLKWEHPGRTVQKRWARSFCIAFEDEGNTTT